MLNLAKRLSSAPPRRPVLSPSSSPEPPSRPSITFQESHLLQLIQLKSHSSTSVPLQLPRPTPLLATMIRSSSSSSPSASSLLSSFLPPSTSLDTSSNAFEDANPTSTTHLVSKPIRYDTSFLLQLRQRPDTPPLLDSTISTVNLIQAESKAHLEGALQRRMGGPSKKLTKPPFERGGRAGAGSSSPLEGGRDGHEGKRPPMDLESSQQHPIASDVHVAPLVESPDRWTGPRSRSQAGLVAESDSSVVDFQLRLLLNKLSPSNFDSISEQILAWANRSEEESDGRTLRRVVQLFFEAATLQELFASLYARLSKKLMDGISPNISDSNSVDSKGAVVSGGPLVRKYLVNRCQEEFEKGWNACQSSRASPRTTEEAALNLDEYYAAQKARRPGLSLIQLVGELFKLDMVTERIVRECVKRSVADVVTPEDVDIELACRILTTVGSSLDTLEAKHYMDVYFRRMNQLRNNPVVSSRLQFMVLDVIELRSRRWKERNESHGVQFPLAQIRDEDLTQAVLLLKQLPAFYANIHVEHLIADAFAARQHEFDLIVQLFSKAAKDSAVSPEDLKAAFSFPIEFLDDLAADFPSAYPRAAHLLAAAQMSREDVEALGETIDRRNALIPSPRDRLVQQFALARAGGQRPWFDSGWGSRSSDVKILPLSHVKTLLSTVLACALKSSSSDFGTALDFIARVVDEGIVSSLDLHDAYFTTSRLPTSKLSRGRDRFGRLLLAAKLDASDFDA